LECVPILLTLEKVEMGATSDNIKGVILDAMGRCDLARPYKF
jgi:hypothetical protein